MKKLLDRVLVVARNPVVRPAEVWALRAVVALVSAKLGFDVSRALGH